MIQAYADHLGMSAPSSWERRPTPSPIQALGDHLRMSAPSSWERRPTPSPIQAVHDRLGLSAPSSWERRRPRRPHRYTDAMPPSGKNKATSIHRRDWFVRAIPWRPCQTVPARAPALPGRPHVTCLHGGHRHGLTHSCAARWDTTSLFGTRSELWMMLLGAPTHSFSHPSRA